MENPVIISNLNDFIFCPMSIYFHAVEGELDEVMYHSEKQIKGSYSHKTIDNQNYSTRKDVLQGIMIYSNEKNLLGKIDLFDLKTGSLIERKRKISKIYDGFVFQLYAQYYCLKEMGYNVETLSLYSSLDNISYSVAKPEDDEVMNRNFHYLLEQFKSFNYDNFTPSNRLKCMNCVYENMCSYSIKDQLHDIDY